MKLAGLTAAVILTEEGRQVLNLAAISLPYDRGVVLWIEESEDLGLWIRIEREDQLHLFLVRWDYILGIDVPVGKGKIVGLKG